jgi:hypothetical protein
MSSHLTSIQPLAEILTSKVSLASHLLRLNKIGKVGLCSQSSGRCHGEDEHHRYSWSSATSNYTFSFVRHLVLPTSSLSPGKGVTLPYICLANCKTISVIWTALTKRSVFLILNSRVSHTNPCLLCLLRVPCMCFANTLYVVCWEWRNNWCFAYTVYVFCG